MSLFRTVPDSWSHYTPMLRLRDLSYKERSAQAKAARAAGFDSDKRWRFKDGDLKAEAQAKAACEAYAKEWEAKLGIGIESCQGFML